MIEGFADATRQGAARVRAGVGRAPGWTIDVGVCVVVLALAGVWASWRWLDLFPLVEFRQQASFGLSLSWLWEQVTLAGPNIWSIPFYFNSRVGDVCGTNVECMNTVLLSLNLITGALLYALVRRLSVGRLLAGVATAAWLIGEPVLDSMAWQATNLDKLAALLVLLGLHVGLTFYRQSFTWRRAVLANIALFAVVLLAQNCKPAAWVLVPMLFLLPVIGGGQRIRSWWAYLILPTLYAVPQAIHVLRLINDDAFYSEHVGSGDVPYNLQTYIGYLGGMLGKSPGSTIAAAAIVATVVLGLVRRAPHARMALFFLLGVAGALLIPARTQYPSPFYMLVPSALAAVLVVLAFLVAKESLPALVRPGITLLAVVALGLYAVNVAAARGHYAALKQMSDNFRASLPVIAAGVDRTTVDGLLLKMDPSNPAAYRFAPQDVEQYIWGAKSGFDAKIVTSPPASPEVTGRMAVATYDAQMHLTRLDVAGKRIVPPAGG